MPISYNAQSYVQFRQAAPPPELEMQSANGKGRVSFAQSVLVRTIPSREDISAVESPTPSIVSPPAPQPPTKKYAWQLDFAGAAPPPVAALPSSAPAVLPASSFASGRNEERQYNLRSLTQMPLGDAAPPAPPVASLVQDSYSRKFVDFTKPAPPIYTPSTAPLATATTATTEFVAPPPASHAAVASLAETHDVRNKSSWQLVDGNDHEAFPHPNSLLRADFGWTASDPVVKARGPQFVPRTHPFVGETTSRTAFSVATFAPATKQAYPEERPFVPTPAIAPERAHTLRNESGVPFVQGSSSVSTYETTSKAAFPWVQPEPALPRPVFVHNPPPFSGESTSRASHQPHVVQQPVVDRAGSYNVRNQSSFEIFGAPSRAAALPTTYQTASGADFSWKQPEPAAPKATYVHKPPAAFQDSTTQRASFKSVYAPVSAIIPALPATPYGTALAPTAKEMQASHHTLGAGARPPNPARSFSHDSYAKPRDVVPATPVPSNHHGGFKLSTGPLQSQSSSQSAYAPPSNTQRVIPVPSMFCSQISFGTDGDYHSSSREAFSARAPPAVVRTTDWLHRSSFALGDNREFAGASEAHDSFVHPADSLFKYRSALQPSADNDAKKYPWRPTPWGGRVAV